MNDSASFLGQDSDSDAFSRNVKFSLLGVSPYYEASFAPFSDQTLADDWQEWCSSVFAKILGPSIRDAVILGQSMQIREIADIDRSLTNQLGDELSQILTAAGKPFTEGKENMRGHREWSKYTALIEAANAPGHLPIVFALHSVLFRMPLAAALQTYCWLEWKAGHRMVDRTVSAGYPEDPSPLFLIAKDSIAEVLQPDSDDQSPTLKAI